MEAHVARPLRRVGDGPVGVAGRQLAGELVEPELENGVDPRMRSLGDVRHVGVAVGRVGLDVVGPDARLPPLNGRGVQRPVLAEAVHSDPRLVVVG